MSKRRENKKGIRYIYGYFTVEGFFRKWHPNPNIDLTPDQQFKHNRSVDPDFSILSIVQQERHTGT